MLGLKRSDFGVQGDIAADVGDNWFPQQAESFQKKYSRTSPDGSVSRGNLK